MSTEEGVSRIKVKFLIEGLGEAEGELVRFLAPRTIDYIVRKLPLEGRAALWKEEVYFEIPLKDGRGKSQADRGAGHDCFLAHGGRIMRILW